MDRQQPTATEAYRSRNARTIEVWKAKLAGMLHKAGLADRFRVSVLTVTEAGDDWHRLMLIDHFPEEPIPEFLYDPEFRFTRSREHKGHVPDDSFFTGEPGPERTSGRVKRVIHNAYYKYGGEEHTLTGWAEKTGIPYATLRYRLVNAWPIGEALTKPVQGRNKRAS